MFGQADRLPDVPHVSGEEKDVSDIAIAHEPDGRLATASAENTTTISWPTARRSRSSSVIPPLP